MSTSFNDNLQYTSIVNTKVIKNKDGRSRLKSKSRKSAQFQLSNKSDLEVKWE